LYTLEVFSIPSLSGEQEKEERGESAIHQMYYYQHFSDNIQLFLEANIV
jgi:hypothetical protein